jgi:type I restriction enzyme R subunit
MIAEQNESTVVAKYVPTEKQSGAYQSEAELEKDFIERLRIQGYDFVALSSEADLLANLRKQIERLNDYTFYDREWQRFCNEYLINKNEGIVEKTRKVQEDYRYAFRLDNGITKNISIIDKKNIHNNHLQIINQYENSGTYDNRYDVTILVNGLPLVHIELKKRGVPLQEAFNQIDRYQRDSFWAGCGLYEYAQIFVISNGTHTKYYSNTTRFSHVYEVKTGGASRSKKTSNSFEFTSYWADGENKLITDLVDFTKTFFAKHTILNILTKYCVFTSEQLLLVMRPYQIAATEKIINRIECSNNYKKMGGIEAGGYIWHTTGSGKTLTSFKTAQLATGLDYIDKVLFVVDRKDLDYQTMKEYDRFCKGAANGNTSTKVLEKQLSDDTRIIVTTIQKLDVFIGRNKGHEVFKKHIVLIFDECHRSQFGDMHLRITKNFKNYHIFGFTGTPIFAPNSSTSGNPMLRTTEQAFGDKLHTYTIVNAINDGNVLPFKVDYIERFRIKDGIIDKKVSAIDTAAVLSDNQLISNTVEYIIKNFNDKTYRNQNLSHFQHRVITNIEKLAEDKKKEVDEIKEEKTVNGFNSIFAVSSIDMAKRYYNEFKNHEHNLKIATIFSYSANEEEPDEEFTTEGLDKVSRDFLEGAIADYNAMFNTNYDTSSDKFQNYYKDLSMRVKNRQIDLLIVVDMFLTGFDATTLNTIWVDKNLKYHKLLQAFSRTNRILNSVKRFGNIVCFRNLEQETNEAISLFGDKDAAGIVLLKPFKHYYDKYSELIEDLKNFGEIIGEESEKEFIELYSAILRLRNILVSFDDYKDNEILTEREFQDYHGKYIDLYQKYRKNIDAKKEIINDDIVFEMELIKQVNINIDYILMLVTKYHDSHCTDKEILETIDKAIGSSLELRSKKELITNFIERMNINTKVEAEWVEFVKEQKEQDLGAIIEFENLKKEETHKFIDNSFRAGELKTTGTGIDKILPPTSLFGENNRTVKKTTVIEKLTIFFEKFFGLV